MKQIPSHYPNDSNPRKVKYFIYIFTLYSPHFLRKTLFLNNPSYPIRLYSIQTIKPYFHANNSGSDPLGRWIVEILSFHFDSDPLDQMISLLSRL